MIRKYKHLIATALFVLLGTVSAWAQPSGGGSGTTDDPYLIGTAADLKAFAQYVGSGHNSASARLNADINLSSVCSSTLGSWTGIGSYSAPYSGTFDGQGHTISGLYIGSGDNVIRAGLFGKVGRATITNLTVEGDVSGTSYVGIFAGEINNSDARISGITTRGTVSGSSNYTGGVAGYVMSGAEVTHCVNYATVNNVYQYCGGLFGALNGKASGCANYGSVNGQYYTAGITGEMNGTSTIIENCLSAGSVSGYSGAGLVSQASGTIRNSLVVCDVTMVDNVTTNVGLLVAQANNGTVWNNNCYRSDATIVYRNGNVVLEDNRLSPKAPALVGNSVGLTTAELSSGKGAYLLQGDQSDLWWTQTIGSDALPTPLGTGSQVYFTGTIYCDGSLEGSYSNTFSSDVTHQDHDFDANEICRNCGIGKTPAEDDGTYFIASVGNFLWLRDAINLRGQQRIKAVQTADLDLSCVCGESLGNWIPIGDTRLAGGQGAMYLEYDGQGHSVSGLYINDAAGDYYGLFSVLYCSSISNLRLSNFVVNAPYSVNVGVLAGYCVSTPFSGIVVESGNVVGSQNVGGVVGNNNANIIRCVNYANVTGSKNAGGICGIEYGGNTVVSECFNAGDIKVCNVSTGVSSSQNTYAGGICGAVNSGSIARCENSGDVTAGNHAAGICADLQNEGTVSDCVSSGTITANYQVGGICSWAYGKITNCLFTGDVLQVGSRAPHHGLILAWSNVPEGITNCYYSATSTLSDERGQEEPSACYSIDVAGAQRVSHDVLVSGEVAFKLQGVRSELVWSQGLDGINLPTVFFTPGEGFRVYLHTGTADCAGTLKTPATFANGPGSEAIYLGHAYGSDGVCTVCGEFQEPELIDGVYHICNYGNLASLRDLVNGGNNTVSAVLDADIDLSPYCGEGKGSFAPFRVFCGYFNGKGHKISGFYFDHKDFSTKYSDGVGLFSVAGADGADAEICHLEIEGNLHSRSYDRTGLLVGQTKGNLAIHHIITRGTVIGRASTGGVVGYMTQSTTISDCVNYASVTAESNSGLAGIVGSIFSNTDLTLENLANYGDINGADLVSGILGYKQENNKLTLRNVANYGNVKGSRVAGIIATNNVYVTIDGAFVSGDVEGSSTSGIVIPYASGNTVTRSYYDGSITFKNSGSPVDISVNADYGKSIAISHDDVVAGRAAYLLGKDWGQQLPGGTMPVLGGLRVYYGRYQHAVAEPIFSEARYTNIIVDETPSVHNFDAGICSICGKHNGEVYNVQEKTLPNWVSTNQGQHGTSSISDKAGYDLGTIIPGSTLVFDWRVSSENNYDKFFASICNYDDDNEVEKCVDNKSGDKSGKFEYTFSSAGHYYLKLWYAKDSSQSNGADTAWAENIKCTSATLIPGKVWADVDGDDDFDVDDITAMRNMILESIAPNGQADLDGDGMISIGDVTEAIHQLIMP